MAEKKKGLFSNLFKPKACGCGVSVVADVNTPAQDKTKETVKTTENK